jgi:hypothetical protein
MLKATKVDLARVAAHALTSSSSSTAEEESSSYSDEDDSEDEEEAISMKTKSRTKRMLTQDVEEVSKRSLPTKSKQAKKKQKATALAVAIDKKQEAKKSKQKQKQAQISERIASLPQNQYVSFLPINHTDIKVREIVAKGLLETQQLIRTGVTSNVRRGFFYWHILIHFR